MRENNRKCCLMRENNRKCCLMRENNRKCCLMRENNVLLDRFTGQVKKKSTSSVIRNSQICKDAAAAFQPFHPKMVDSSIAANQTQQDLCFRNCKHKNIISS